ncbi:FadR/GntR family transcriptional regulator [Fodinicurvata sediminis]|uniref:FadR/GntR family transcriptional regulator n=1 Tax=Fodinicurvata sediminis TaxID=1121832 RepID=UPI000422A6B6|nr:FCD domain-containing protein [Fodinicurvata sediminis]
MVEMIKRWVVQHNLKVGDRLPRERDLISILKCSRGTIREALKILEYQGLVEITPGAGGGTRIARISYNYANEFLRNYFYFQDLTWDGVYRIREQLEPLVAESVVGVLGDAELQALRETLAICESGLAGEIPADQHRTAELEFHSILARSCPDPLLSFLAGFINDLLRDFTEYKNEIEIESSTFAEAALRYHKKLLQAYEDGDVKAVRSLMADHMHDARCIVSSREQTIKPEFLLLRTRTGGDEAAAAYVAGGGMSHKRAG